MKDYYQLELDDMVIALVNKDAEIESLQKKLDIAVEALEGITNPTIGDIYNKLTDEIDYSLVMDIAQKALKEIDDSLGKCDKSHFFPSKNVKG